LQLRQSHFLGGGDEKHLHADRPAKLNDVDPPAWPADMLARLPDHPARRIADLLPWQWCGSRRQAA
jgi:hypothetical protein